MPLTKRHAVLAAAVSASATALTAPAADAAVTPLADQARAVVRQAVHAHERAVDRNVRLARTNAKLRGIAPHRTQAEVRDWTLTHLGHSSRRLEHANQRLRRQARATTATAGGATQTPGNLQAIAACESGGNPGAVDASGTYRGKYQFDRQTWQSIGGTGDPAAAPEAVQDALAAKLYQRSGSTPWPVCGG